jgi:hypothetical protein
MAVLGLVYATHLFGGITHYCEPKPVASWTRGTHKLIVQYNHLDDCLTFAPPACGRGCRCHPSAWRTLLDSMPWTPPAPRIRSIRPSCGLLRRRLLLHQNQHPRGRPAGLCQPRPIHGHRHGLVARGGPVDKLRKKSPNSGGLFGTCHPRLHGRLGVRGWPLQMEVRAQGFWCVVAPALAPLVGQRPVREPSVCTAWPWYH